MKPTCLALAVLLTTALAGAAPLSDRSAPPPADPWLPGNGNFGVALATGIPFPVMGELSMGVTDYAAFGVLAGTTPIVSGFGFRPRGGVPITQGFRILLSTPTLYYPPTAHAPAWWLSRPSALLDGEVTEGVHFGLGGGCVGIVTHDRLFGRGSEAQALSPYGHPGKGRTSDGWGTLNAFTSLAASEQTSFFAEGTVVLSASGLADDRWIGGPPVVLFLGVNRVL